MAERIYLSSPDVTEAEETALVRAFRSGWIAPLDPETRLTGGTRLLVPAASMEGIR